jgi:hypothetical protein
MGFLGGFYADPVASAPFLGEFSGEVSAATTGSSAAGRATDV